jgi:lysophospholipase L1-like esterase
MLKKAIGDKKAALIVVSLGINDADNNDSTDSYKKNYSALLTALKTMTSRLALVSITGLDTTKPDVGRRTQPVIDGYNAALPEIARGADAWVIPMPAMPTGFTTDGIHLSASGYTIWNKAISDSITATFCPNG